MLNLRSLLLIILLLALLMAPMATAQPSNAQREATYLHQLDRLPYTQNSDGGFGPVTEILHEDGNTTNITTPTHQAFLQTVLSVHLLVVEKTDRLETWENWEGEPTSLARSNATSARDWLQQYEKQNEGSLTPGDYALLSLAYHDLGDNENARQLLVALLDQEAQGESNMGAMDLAKVLFTQQHAGYEINETHQATLEGLDDRLAAMGLSAPEPLSWALLAQPGDGDRRSDLVSRLNGDVSSTLKALGAWALAGSGGADTATEDAILALHQQNPALNTLPRLFLLLAEHTAHPHFSPHVSLEEGRIARGSGAGTATGEVLTPAPQEETTPPPVTPTPQEPVPNESPGASFPLPPWAMMGILLVALAVLMVTGLAYGLKREDLDGPRKHIFDYIDNHPGEHFSKIRRDLNLAPGTFQHHLSVLESGGWITSYKDSRYKRYFVNGNRYKQMIAGYQYKQKFAALANDTTRDLVQFIRDHPGVTQKEVALRMNLHASTVNWHANRLKQAGILNPERVGREVRYHVDVDEVKKMLQQANN